MSEVPKCSVIIENKLETTFKKDLTLFSQKKKMLHSENYNISSITNKNSKKKNTTQ